MARATWLEHVYWLEKGQIDTKCNLNGRHNHEGKEGVGKFISRVSKIVEALDNLVVLRLLCLVFEEIRN